MSRRGPGDRFATNPSTASPHSIEVRPTPGPLALVLFLANRFERALFPMPTPTPHGETNPLRPIPRTPRHPTVACLLALAALLMLTRAHGGTTDLPRVRISPDGREFHDAAGHAFVPMGVTYYRPHTGWAPQVWKQFDEGATREDFARLRDLGANCVRVFLTYGSFLSTPERVDPEGLRKLDRFIDLAAEHGLYVHPTGPDHWEGLPDWARGDRMNDPRVLDALRVFWTGLASHLRGRSTVFAYDLLNEPEVPWDTPVQRAAWNEWLRVRYPDPAALAAAWKRSDLPEWGAIPIPPKEDAELDPRLLDYQHFRESIAVRWTRIQSEAIRAADPEALVTVGLIQWSVPVVLVHVGHYSGFRPEQHAPFLDFLTFHFYPLAEGAYLYQGEAMERRNLAYLEALTGECARLGKPVVIGEFGWHGGGSPRAFKNAPVASEEDQARWCRSVVEQTRSRVQGWLNWGLRDQPEATDVSQFTGLLTAEGREKAWGREFRRLSQERRDGRLSPARSAPRDHPPSMEWDRLITSRKAADAFRARHLEAFRPTP